MNNSVIPISEIGTELTNSTSEALQCITDLRPCCRQSETSAIQQMLMGEWYYPDGTRVPDNEGDDVFFATRGLNDGTVNLFRRNTGVMSPVGSYCCEIPDTTGTNQTLCAITGEHLQHYIHNHATLLLSYPLSRILHPG